MISAYLRELSEALRFDPPLARAIVQDVGGHLHEAADAEPVDDRQEAERRATQEAAALKVAQIMGRNYPLVLLAALIGLLFWPSSPDDEGTTIPAFKPNGSDEASPSLYRH